MKGIFGKVVDFASGLRQATTAAHELIAERRRAIAAKRAELQRAEAGPRPPAEVIGRFEAWVDELAAYQAREYGRGLVVHRFGSVSKEPGTGAPWGPGTELTWGFAALFLGPELKQRFADLVRATAYEAGPPAAERPALVERLRGELAQLEAEEEQLVDEAAAAGVTIAHRAPVCRATPAGAGGAGCGGPRGPGGDGQRPARAGDGGGVPVPRPQSSGPALMILPAPRESSRARREHPAAARRVTPRSMARGGALGGGRVSFSEAAR
jgi:hypothetical protein